MKKYITYFKGKKVILKYIRKPHESKTNTIDETINKAKSEKNA